MRKYFLLSILLLLVMLLAAACSDSSSTSDSAGETVGSAVSEEDQIALLGNMQSLISGEADEADVVDLLDDNISKFSPVRADEAVRMVDKYLNEKVVARSDEFFLTEPNVQELFYQEFSNKNFISIGLDQMDISNKQLADLISMTYARGYVIEVAEGSFYPAVDYSSMRMYMDKVTPAMADYIAYMALETEKPSNEDAGLLISFDEVYQRLMQADIYIKKYPDSPEIKKMQEYLDFYVISYVYGLNNTPVFDYQTNKMTDYARESYDALKLSDSDSQIQSSLKKYIKILKNNHYTLTAEVETARKKIFPLD